MFGPCVRTVLFLSSVALIITIAYPSQTHCTHVKAKSSKHRSNLCTKNVTSRSANEFYHATSGPKFYLLNHKNCLDIPLQYSATMIPEYVPDFNFSSFDEIVHYLQRWQGFRRLPKCWPYLQKGLCSVLMPEYQDSNVAEKTGRISRPSVDICNDVVHKNNCKFVEEHYGWPSIFNCNDTNLYAKNCINELREQRVAMTSEQCPYPLVPSNDPQVSFKDVAGCTMHCKYPILKLDHQNNISLLVKILATLGLVASSSAILIFQLNESQSKSSRIAGVIKRSNFCHFIIYVGWCLQILSNTEVGCSPTGSPLSSLPLVANICVLSFFLTYLPSLANLVWYAHLGKLCHEKLIGSEKKSAESPNIDRNLSLLSYGFPAMMFIMVAFLGQIDGNGLHGICIVSQQSLAMKMLFLYIPTVVAVGYGNLYFTITIIKLVVVKSMKPSLRRNFVRISALTILSSANILLTTGNHAYSLFNERKWHDSIHDYVVCSLNPGPLNDSDYDPDSPARQDCSIDSQPIVFVYYLEILSTLASGLVFASWAWCDSNFRGLKRRLIEMLEDENDRQRRAKGAQNPYNSWAAYAYAQSGKDMEDVNQKAHDLIDMTSPTHTEQAIDMNNNLNQVRPPSEMRQSEGSLASVELPASWQHSRRPSNSQFTSSRDVVNNARSNQDEEKRRQLEQLTNMLALNQPVLNQPVLSQDQLEMYKNLMKLQSNPVATDYEQEFVHGICQFE